MESFLGEFFAQKTLRDKFGGVNTIKKFLGALKTPPALERPFKAATKGDEATDLSISVFNECKYIEKEMIRYINEDIEVFSSDSGEK